MDRSKAAPSKRGAHPRSGSAFTLAQAKIPEENAHGNVYRAGRACVKLHAGGSGPEREAVGLARCEDECAGAPIWEVARPGDLFTIEV